MRQGRNFFAPGTRSTAAIQRHRERIRGIAGVLCLVSAAAISGCDGSMGGDASHKVNGAVHIAAGQPAGSAETVNGSIHVDDGAAVTAASTVNGSIHLGAHSTADTATTVNGSVTLGAGAHVAHSVESVNGALKLGDHAEVLGGLRNVGGDIELTAAHVAGGIRTVSGSISVLGDSHVDGGIHVEKTSNSLIRIGGIPRIVIGPGATVQGELRFDQEVHLYVSDRATIGAVAGATPVTYPGDTAPN